ncbi:MAG: VWA domain-containing protein [Dehalococcoidia bacterium]|nr:VWA domain-containing protein [Dehalococcoidia bacterium]
MRVESGGPALGLSGYWRIDTSEDRSRELASVLSGAASLAELVQTRLRQSRHSTGRASIAPVVVDPRLLSGFSAPIPAPVVDCLVGLAIREAAFRELFIDSSNWQHWESLSEEDQREFSRVHRALEDVYAYARLTRIATVLGRYLTAMRAMLAPRMPSGDVLDIVSRDIVLELWLRGVLHEERLPDDSSAELREAVAILNDMTVGYTTLRHPRERLDRAGEVWSWLRTLPRSVRAEPSFDERASDAILDSGLESEAEANRTQMRKNVMGGAAEGGFTDLSCYLLDTPRKPATKESTDFVNGAGEGTRIVSRELHELGIRASTTMVRNARFDPDDYEKVRMQVVQEIEAVRHLFARLDDVESRFRHGLRRGKLDGRSLSKLGAGKLNVFKLRDNRHRTSMALVFLIDVSASMRSYMSVVDRAACVVAEALRGLAPQVWYEVLTYTSGGLHPGAPVQLTRLASTGFPLSLRDVWSDGGTPTGEAISAALLELRMRRAERKLILHFTDGHPKDTYVVRQALELCRRDRVDVLTISVGASQEALYGVDRCEVAYTVSELPSVLTRLLPRLYR